MRKKRQAGQAAILIIFVLGMISVLIGLSLVQTGFGESLMGRANPLSAQAFYIANSGLEEALYQLNKNSAYVGTTLFMTEGQTAVRVYKDAGQADDQRTIESEAKSGLYIRKIRATADQSSGFDYAVEAGSGGLKMANNTLVNGNVYSNSYIEGKHDCPHGSSASKIEGNASAVTNINADICISGVEQYPAPPITLPLSPQDILDFQTPLNQPGLQFGGTCNPDGSNDIDDCTKGVKENGIPVLGNIKIVGDLNVNNDLKFSGPVWTTGQLVFNSTANIGLTDTLFDNPEKEGQIVLVDKEIIVDHPNVIFQTRNGVFLLIVSTSTTACSGNDAAISIKSNTENVLFYAKNGCVLVNQNVSFNGAILGDSIKMDQYSTISYNSGLSDAKFALTDTLNLPNFGPWQTISFKEE